MQRAITSKDIIPKQFRVCVIFIFLTKLLPALYGGMPHLYHTDMKSNYSGYFINSVKETLTLENHLTSKTGRLVSG